MAGEILVFSIDYYYYLHLSFSHQRYLIVFQWSLSDRTLLSILAVLNNAVVLMVSTRLPTSKSFSPSSNSLVTVPKAPITIGIIVTSMFHSFFQFSRNFEVFILHYYYYYYYYYCDFFTAAINNGFSLEYMWWIFSSVIQEFSWYLHRF